LGTISREQLAHWQVESLRFRIVGLVEDHLNQTHESEVRGIECTPSRVELKW
jgi:hypothetical protein